MKNFYLIILLTFTISSFAQQRLITGLSIDSTTKIIGRYPHHDKDQTYKEFNFILENLNDIQEAISSLTYGNEYKNTFENPDFIIEIIQNFKVVKTFSINPKQSSVRFDGRTYAFELNQLKDLASRFPFKYRFEIIVFNSMAEYLKHLNEQKQNPKFLFDYKPQFKYEGSFEIEFPRNRKFSSPKAISQYSAPIVEKLVPKGKYSISYILNNKNLKDQTQFTMTFQGPKILFDQLKIDKLKNINWKKMIEDGYFFYKE